MEPAMEELLINGRCITIDRLGDENFPGIPTEQSTEIIDFLKEWWNADDFITVQTSGSTGAPKKIRLLKSTIVASADKTIQYFGLTAGQSLLLCLPCRYIAGKLMLVRAMRALLNVVAIPTDLNPLQHLNEKIDFAAMIPAQIKTALEDPSVRKKLQNISTVLLGGAPVEPNLEIELARLSNRFFHSYGMTETATHVALREIGKSSGYTALEGVQFSIDERGCLVIESNHLPETIITNDLVELLNEREFRWLGRFDNAIISGGLKHIPELLEKKMAPFISSPFYVSGASDVQLGQKLVLHIESESWSEDEVENLRSQLKSILQLHELPKEIEFQKQFKRTYTGKIKRR